MASHQHHHHHHHDPDHVHPPATISRSILRQSLAERLGLVAVLIAALWAAVYWTIG